jgi:hypothetical protein
MNVNDREETHKQNCYFFYDTKNNRHKTVEEIKDKFKCQKTKNGRKMLYAKRDNTEEYDFVSQTKLRDYNCVLNYNSNFNPEKDSPNHKNLDTEALLENCSDNSFRDINPDYDKLLQYAYRLSDELHVDEEIKKFVVDLVVYTNINKEGLDELYKGAFVIIRDKGFFYNRFKCGTARICDTKKFLSESSHDSLYKDPQYRIGNGVLYNCDENGICDKNQSNTVFDLLIGTSPNNYFYGDTWMQFEYANLLTIWNKYALHVYSFVKHKWTGQNVGPLGESVYAEYVKPLILEICNPAVCTNPPCEPVPCVRPKINLQEYSETFLRENNISIQDYKDIKDFIKSKFGSTSRIKIADIKKEMSDYIKAYDDYQKAVRDDDDTTNIRYTTREQYLLCKSMIPYIDSLSETDNYNYDRDEIIEIMFLIFYYFKENKTNYTELKNIIDQRYASSRKTGGKRNKRKTKSLKKNKRKTRKNRK